MLWKCCTQYGSKFGKLSRGHRTRKYQFSFQLQRKVMPKNVQTITHLHWIHMLTRLCSKSFKLAFSITWTKNFQMYKLGFEAVEEPKVKLPTSVGSQRKQGNFRKTLTSLTMVKPLTVWITTNCGKFSKRWEYQVVLFVSCKTCMKVRKQVRTLYGTTDWFKIEKGVQQGCVSSHCLFSLYMMCLA